MSFVLILFIENKFIDYYVCTTIDFISLRTHYSHRAGHQLSALTNIWKYSLNQTFKATLSEVIVAPPTQHFDNN